MTVFALLSACNRNPTIAQDSVAYPPNATSSAANASGICLPYAHFQIPFNVDKTGSKPAAVQLMVSTDGGKTWQQHGRASADDRCFDFRAAAEGDYLFTVQTVDSTGVVFPSQTPPMRVQVDTTKPQAAVRADLDHSGNLIVDLRVADEHIDLKSAVLKVRTDRDPQWREVPVTSLSPVGGYFEGQVEVLIPACREIAIVFSINDQAKNTGSASYLFTMPRTAAQSSDLQLASSPGRIEAGRGIEAERGNYGSSQIVEQTPAQGIPGAVAWDLQPNTFGQPTLGQQYGSQGNPAIHRATSGNSTSGNVTSNVSGANFTTVENHFAQQPVKSSNTVRPANPGAVGNRALHDQLQSSNRQGNFPTTPRGSNLNALAQQSSGQGSGIVPNATSTKSILVHDDASEQSAIAQRAISTPGPGQLARATLDVELSPAYLSTPEELSLPSPLNQTDSYGGAVPNRRVDSRQPQRDSDALNGGNRLNNPYYCKSTTFSLDYSVEALGGNALSEVELWGTEDNGRTWEKWGSDPDRVSPFDVKVGNDGLFGFRMVLIGPGGSVMGVPKPGDDADAWIRVDSQPPTCKITRALYGVGSEAGMLVIDYTCSDEDLADEGITLSWSQTLDGPWTPFASAIRNTGLYLWKADASLPSRVYLKMEAIDKAGNVSTHKMDLPIDTKGLSPRGRIQGIRPLPSK